MDVEKTSTGKTTSIQRHVSAGSARIQGAAVQTITDIVRIFSIESESTSGKKTIDFDCSLSLVSITSDEMITSWIS